MNNNIFMNRCIFFLTHHIVISKNKIIFANVFTISDVRCPMSESAKGRFSIKNYELQIKRNDLMTKGDLRCPIIRFPISDYLTV